MDMRVSTNCVVAHAWSAERNAHQGLLGKVCYANVLQQMHATQDSFI